MGGDGVSWERWKKDEGGLKGAGHGEGMKEGRMEGGEQVGGILPGATPSVPQISLQIPESPSLQLDHSPATPIAPSVLHWSCQPQTTALLPQSA